MNSEELELSLRTEFENYLKNARAEMRREASEFQERIESEFDKQKTQFDEAFRSFTARFEAEPEFDDAFTATVAEHLRTARDDGARVAAAATEEAVKLAREEMQPPSVPAPRYDEIRDAVKDISTKETQSAILKALVSHAQQFAPRGAFFIIKSEHFAGWKVFGASEEAEAVIRDVHFPTSEDTILAAASSSLDAAEDGRSGDRAFLDPLGFGDPNRMCAIPLVARNRGVAVLYVDQGEEDGDVNREALETLVTVAGLTVEMIASMHAARVEDRAVAADFEQAQHESDVPHRAPAAEEPAATEPSFDEAEQAMPSAEDETPAEFNFSESVVFEGGFPHHLVPPETVDAPESAVSDEAREEAAAEGHEAAPMAEEQDEAQAETVEFGFAESPFAEDRQAATEASFDEYRQPEAEVFDEHAQPETEPSFEEERQPEPETVDFDGEKTDPDLFPAVETSDAAISFDSDRSREDVSFDSSPFSAPVVSEEQAPAVSIGGFVPAVEPVVEAPVQPAPRLRDRQIDLPIEVPDEERRIHNDARRFARLLVSEIKLYNEKKVVEGREASDLYERLREAIDRSREMYDKRVQPPVAAKFDYFHYEIVNALAEGDASRLGSGYPGSTV